MVDKNDSGKDFEKEDGILPLNFLKKKTTRQTAVALKTVPENPEVPKVSAAGRGEMAEKILQLAFENGVPVREDGELAEMLATIELDSPIPSEAFLAVAEILSYVYKANKRHNPFDVPTDNGQG